ncbi:Serine/threonine protein kinase PrkC, regulator of stationary phase [Enhygromyxa salina]|uniref:non-specific serine/threonine protein kinase n=1 Tax=Enhygromyxa salina TaxID=215803 RepID=A0A0C2CQ78_9BACT|nr:serine/threonine-protein kinase [Enhygromyxa salina]KIG13341.1 Serine/threonine protein kinase PrkC, regulator of stationary phase [Enhygromyxa salina]
MPKSTVLSAAPPPAAPQAAAPQAAEDLGSGGTMISMGEAVPEIVAPTPSQSQNVHDLIGTVLLGRYRVIKKLGEGGMGTVYLGEHAQIGKKFAVKVLSHEYAHKEDLRERFLQEARAASMISQENVVEITDFGDTPDGSVFFIMEFLNGEDLSDTVKNHGRLPWARVKHIMLQVCRALAAAHDAGIIHRDMKPENCYRITRGKNEDFIKVLDFGIAKVTSEEEGEGKGLTRTGMIFGTPEYMSPEQAQGAKPDHRVDVYALGVILYELLTGRVPFTADTFMGILTKHMFEIPEAPSALVPEAEIPAEVEAIILKAMQKDRELRFADMREMAAAIEAVGSGAAAVAFVNENIARPSTGEMAFTGSRTVMPGTVPPVSATDEEQGGSKKGLIFGLVGGLALVAAGVGAFIAFGGDGGDKTADAKEEPAAVAKAPEPDVVEQPVTPPVVEEPEKVKEIADGTETVTYRITTTDAEGNPVIASILDPRDNGSYGKTNTPEGVSVEKSTERLPLTLRAAGFEPQTIEIVPDSDKKFEYVMQPIQKAAPKKTVTNKKKADPAPDPTPTPKEDAKTKKPPRRVSPDLKDPFGSRGG